jgi:hypothetical protein
MSSISSFVETESDMAEPSAILETAEYRVVLVEPESGSVMALDTAQGYCLPRLEIPLWTRQAPQLRAAIRAEWGLRALILEFVGADDSFTTYVVAELLTALPRNSEFKAIVLDELSPFELSARDRSALALILSCATAKPLSRVGWINEAVAWIEGTTGQRLSSKDDVEQLNAGGGFALVRFSMEDGTRYWLKATGAPNHHEFPLTVCLSELCPAFLPPLVATKKEWNAWLTKEVGTPQPDPTPEDSLINASKTFASLQLQTVDCLDVLLASGAFDQRLQVLKSHIDPITTYLVDAMARQRSTRVAPLSVARLLELAELLGDACVRMERLDIPDTLIHNDLSLGNILHDGARCVFTDWSEAAIGNPFLSCERLCQLNRDHRETVCAAYRRTWSHRVNAANVDEAFVLMPLLAIYAYLYGRGDWLEKRSIDPQFDAYARSLARHMDRAAQSPELQEVLCR